MKERHIWILIIVLIGGIFLISKIRDEIILRNGAFVLFQIDGRSQASNGITYRGRYWYNDKQYRAKVKSAGRGYKVGDFLFIKISRKYPKILNIMDYLDLEVPACITLEKMPKLGWDSIPTCR